jgi:holin-like protein
VKTALIFLGQLLIITVVYKLSEYAVAFLQLPIPASVFGMILLFLLLITGILKVRYIEKAAAFLNKHLAFFFIPYAVALMNYGDLIKSSGLQLLLMIIGSSIVGLLITSGLTQYLIRREEKKHGQPDHP